MPTDPNEALSYTPMGEQVFDKENFIQEYSKASRLESILKTLTENPNDADSISAAGIIIKNDESFYFTNNNIANTIQNVKDTIPTARKGIETYAAYNEESLLGFIPDEKYIDLVKSVKLAKKDGDEKHNSIVEAQEELLKFSEAAQDQSKLEKFIAEKMKKSKDKAVVKEYNRMRGTQSYMQSVIEAYHGHYVNQFEIALHTEGVNFKNVFKDSLENAKDKGQYYQAIAREAYNAATAKKK